MGGFQKLDQKQIPQVIGLGVGFAVLIGYVGFKVIAPSAAAAPVTQPVAHTHQLAIAAAGGSAAATASAAATGPALTDAPAPNLAMRNPFLQTISSTTTASPPPTVVSPKPTESIAQVSPGSGANGTVAVPAASLGSLPPMAGAGTVVPGVEPSGITGAAVPALPAAAAPPQWTVTGILQGSQGTVAIMRDGTERAYAHPGEMVDPTYRITAVTPDYVVLRHGTQVYTLPLGAAKTAPAPAVSAAPGTSANSAPAVSNTLQTNLQKQAGE